VEVPKGNGGDKAGAWYAREMPMSFMVAMENLTDPSHFSFAHHGVTPSAMIRLN
jgi:phenylpropionate dioxygenase-like ring-hydroxylating dioxygenase large terminal subunit